jgi:hypothetical protein
MSNPIQATRCLVLAALVTGAASALPAQSGGWAEAGAQYYYDSLPGLSASGLFANATYFLPRGGILDATFNLVRDGRNDLVLGLNSLALREVSFLRSRISIAAGDLAVALDRPGFRFSNDYAARPLFRGGAVGSESETLSLSLFGGRNEQLQGSRIPTVQFAPEAFVGAVGVARLPGDAILDFSALGVRNERPGATSLFGTDLPDQAQTFALGLSKSFSPAWRVQGRLSYGRSEFAPGSTSASGGFLSYLVGGIHEDAHWHLEANYLRYGKSYVPLSTAFIGDREGPFLLATYRGGRLTSSAVYQHYRNNPENTAGLPKLESTSFQFASTVLVGTLHSLSANYGDQLLDSSVGASVSNFRQRTASVQASVTTFGSTRVRYQFQDESLTDGNRQIHEALLEHQLFLAGWSVGAGVRFQRDNRGATSTLYRGSLDGGYGPVRLFLNGEWGNDLASGTVFSVNQNRAITYGASLKLPGEFLLTAEGYKSRTKTTLSAESVFLDPNASIFSSDRSTVLVRLTHAFQWGGAGRGEVLQRERLVLPYGTLEGTVYSDLDANGVRETGEPPVPGIAVRLDGGTLTRTDAAGRYVFHNVIEGEHTVELDMEELPVAYNPPQAVRVRVQVERLRPGGKDFGLIRTGSLAGRVEEALASGERRGLAGAIVTLLPPDFSTFTDEDGAFTFSNLPPGRYMVRLQVESLPPGAQIADIERKDLALAGGGALAVAPFVLTLLVEDKPVRQIFEKEQVVPRTRPKPKPTPPPGSAKPNPSGR